MASGTPTPEEWADARRFRSTFGLRDDDAWIIAVAADPSSAEGVATYGIPLTPAELADLLGRPAMADGASVVVIDTYGRGFPDEWAGLFVDQQHGGVLAAQFSDRVEVHRRALMDLLPAGTLLEVLEVPFSMADLEGFMADVASDAPWFESTGLTFYAADVDAMANQVRVRFTGPDPAAEDAVEAHFGRPDWLRAAWSGPKEWTGPTGTLIVEVVDSAGRPLPGLDCEIDDPVTRVFQGDPPASETTDTGRCTYRDYPAVPYDATIADGSTEPATPLATQRANLASTGETLVRIVIDRP